MSRVAQTLRVRETGSAAKPPCLTWSAVLHSIVTRLVRVGALNNHMVSYYSINYANLIESAEIRDTANMTDLQDKDEIEAQQ